MLSKAIKTLTIATLLATSVSAFAEETINGALSLGSCQVKILQDVIFTKKSQTERITNSKGSILDVTLEDSMVSNDVRRIKAGRKLEIRSAVSPGNADNRFEIQNDKSIRVISYKSIGSNPKFYDSLPISVNTFNQRFEGLASISCTNSDIVDI